MDGTNHSAALWTSVALTFALAAYRFVYSIEKGKRTAMLGRKGKRESCVVMDYKAKPIEFGTLKLGGEGCQVKFAGEEALLPKDNGGFFISDRVETKTAAAIYRRMLSSLHSGSIFIADTYTGGAALLAHLLQHRQGASSSVHSSRWNVIAKHFPGLFWQRLTTTGERRSVISAEILAGCFGAARLKEEKGGGRLYVGLDCEWAQLKDAKVALLQLCFCRDGRYGSWESALNMMSNGSRKTIIPFTLLEIAELLAQIRCRGWIELANIARSCELETEGYSLKKLAKAATGLTIPKSKKVQCSDWDCLLTKANLVRRRGCILWSGMRPNEASSHYNASPIGARIYEALLTKMKLGVTNCAEKDIIPFIERPVDRSLNALCCKDIDQKLKNDRKQEVETRLKILQSQKTYEKIRINRKKKKVFYSNCKVLDVSGDTLMYCSGMRANTYIREGVAVLTEGQENKGGSKYAFPYCAREVQLTFKIRLVVK
eukprot:jgi/Bigna1/81416/fgenesh1_pg.80_\